MLIQLFQGWELKSKLWAAQNNKIPFIDKTSRIIRMRFFLSFTYDKSREIMEAFSAMLGSPASGFGKDISGIPESNRHLNLGKVAYCHYTNPALNTEFLSGFCVEPDTSSLELVYRAQSSNAIVKEGYLRVNPSSL